MKTLTRAFSLVELLLVVTILSIVSIAGFTSFSRLSSFGEEGEITGKITTSLRELDEQITAKKLDSYEVIFEPSAAGYVVRLGENSVLSGSLNMNWDSGTGTLHMSSDSAGDWRIPFIADGQRLQTITFSGSTHSVGFRLPKNPTVLYSIEPFFNEKERSIFEIHAFSSYGLTGERGVWRVSGLPGGANKVIIRNIRGTRTVTDGTSSVASGSEIEISNHGKTATFQIP